MLQHQLKLQLQPTRSIYESLFTFILAQNNYFTNFSLRGFNQEDSSVFVGGGGEGCERTVELCCPCRLQRGHLTTSFVRTKTKFYIFFTVLLS